MSNTIDALALKKAFIAGANNLDKNKEYINELNVFPVPDGDTGTNMSMTITNSVAKAMSTGSLRGARGNSGVILSQLLRGFSKKVQDARTIDVHVIADAFQKAVETAYKAVMKPKEGTILTVAKGVASKAREWSIQVDRDSWWCSRVQSTVSWAELQLNSARTQEQ